MEQDKQFQTKGRKPLHMYGTELMTLKGVKGGCWFRFQRKA